MPSFFGRTISSGHSPNTAALIFNHKSTFSKPLPFHATSPPHVQCVLSLAPTGRRAPADRQDDLPRRICVSVTLRKKRIRKKLLTQILLKFTGLSTSLFSALICAESPLTEGRYSSLFGVCRLKLCFYELRNAYLQIPLLLPLTGCWEERCFEHRKTDTQINTHTSSINKQAGHLLVFETL